MKRILSIILLCVTSLCAVAQEDVTLFFLNDGTFKGFYDEEIDSIAYSHFDLDSVWHSDAVVQEVWLADSVVRIPIEKIDSICHKIPEPEYRPETIILDDRYLPYITSVNGLTISFSSGLPENLRPREGDVLYYNGISELFPEGFAGKVISVGNTVTCEQAGIPDIYQKFVFFGKYTVVRKDQNNKPSYALRRIKGRKENVHDGLAAVSATNTEDIDDYFGIGEGSFPDFNIGSFKDAFEFELKDWNVKIKTSFKVTPVFTIEYTYAFNFFNPILFYKCKKTFNYVNSYSIAYAPDYNLLKDDKFWEKVGDLPEFQKIGDYQLTRDINDRGTVYFIDKKYPIPECPLIQVGAKVGFFITPKLEGELVLGATNKGTYEKTYIYNLDKNHWLNLSDDWKDYLLPWRFSTGQYLKLGDGQCYDGPKTCETTEWYLDGSVKGSIWTGLVAGASGSAGFGKNAEVKEEAKFRIGPYLEGEIKLSMLDGLSDWSRYSLVKDTHVKVGVKLGLDISFSAKLKSDFLGCDVGFQWDQIDWTPKNLLWEKTWYLLPEYEAPKYMVKGNSLICTTNVTRKTFPNTIGFALFDEKGNVKRQYMTDTYKDYDGKTPFYMSLTFDGLDFANHRYTIAPSSELFKADWLKFDAPDAYRTTVLCPDSHHPHLIDLGLPSGTKWLCSNLHADDPKDAGGYYQWGKPYMVHSYTDITYRAPNFMMANYQSSEYDAATVNLGQEYCTPTMSQFNELHDNCSMDYKYSPRGNVLGMFLKGKNSNNLYLPFSGYKSGVKVNNNSEGWFVSSDAVDSNKNLRKAVVLKNNDVIWHSNDAMAYGHSVRPVSAGSDGLVFEPQQLDYDEVNVGQKVGQYVTVTNNGNTSISVTVAQTIAPFQVDEASLGTFTVKPKEPHSVLVYFSPTEEKEYTSVLTLSYEAGNSCIVSKVPLKGKGINASIPLQLSTNTLTLTTGQQGTVDVTSGSGSYAAESNATNVATVTVEGSKLIIKGVSLGSATITVKDNHTQERANIEVTVTESSSFTDGQIVMERKYYVDSRGDFSTYWEGGTSANYAYQQISLSFDNNQTLSINYLNAYYWDNSSTTQRKGVYIIGYVGGEKVKEWYIHPRKDKEWIKEKIIVTKDGKVSYFSNDTFMGEETFDQLSLQDAKNVTINLSPYGWWYTHYHYMDDFIITTPAIIIKDDFNDGVLDTNIWQSPANPDGVREEDGILKAEQLRTDIDFHLKSKPIPLVNIPLQLSTNTLTLTTGQQGTVNITSGSGSYAAVSNATNVATVTVEGSELIIKGVAQGTATITVKDLSSGETAEIKVAVGDGYNVPAEAIDLGLPSGTLWASCNVGATKPEEFGGYYAWGETQEKDSYTWGNYSLCTDGDKNTCYEIEDIGGTNYDVASSKLGNGWRTPSPEQLKELVEYCTYQRTNLNNVRGSKFIGPNGNSIFLPSAGYRWEDKVEYLGTSGLYMSSASYYKDSSWGLCTDVNKAFVGVGWRLYGENVRPVRSK